MTLQVNMSKRLPFS